MSSQFPSFALDSNPYFESQSIENKYELESSLSEPVIEVDNDVKSNVNSSSSLPPSKPTVTDEPTKQDKLKHLPPSKQQASGLWFEKSDPLALVQPDVPAIAITDFVDFRTYSRQILEEFRAVLCHTYLDALERLLSLKSCSLRPYKEKRPHHLESREKKLLLLYERMKTVSNIIDHCEESPIMGKNLAHPMTNQVMAVPSSSIPSNPTDIMNPIQKDSLLSSVLMKRDIVRVAEINPMTINSRNIEQYRVTSHHNQSALKIPFLPTLDELDRFIYLHRSNPGCVQYIEDVKKYLEVMKHHAEQLWHCRILWHNQLESQTRDLIREMCLFMKTETLNLFDAIPKLLKSRIQEEDMKFHQPYQLELKHWNEKRNDFYVQFQNWAEKQSIALNYIMDIIWSTLFEKMQDWMNENELDPCGQPSPPPNTAVTSVKLLKDRIVQAQKSGIAHFSQLRESLLVWNSTLQSCVSNGSRYPLLPNLYAGLVQWIGLIQFLIIRTLSMHPDQSEARDQLRLWNSGAKHVSVRETFRQQEKNSDSSSSSQCDPGLDLQFHTIVRTYFAKQEVEAMEAWKNTEQYRMDLLNRKNEVEHEMEDLERPSMMRNGSQYISNSYNNNKGSNIPAPVSAQEVSRTYLNEIRMGDLRRDLRILNDEYQQLQPELRLKTDTLFKLNEIVDLLNGFFKDNESQWTEWVQKEARLVEDMATARSYYRNGYLGFRSHTVQLVQMAIQDTQDTLDIFFSRSMVKLSENMGSTLENLKKQTMLESQRLSENFTLISHRQKLIASFQDIALSECIQNLKRAFYRIHDQADLEHRIDYESKIQNAIKMFKNHLVREMNEMFKSDSCLKCLHSLDHICNHHFSSSYHDGGPCFQSTVDGEYDQVELEEKRQHPESLLSGSMLEQIQAEKYRQVNQFQRYSESDRLQFQRQSESIDRFRNMNPNDIKNV